MKKTSNNSFFFLIDFLKNGYEKNLLLINNFFRNEKINILSSVKYFLFYSNYKIDFIFLEKNYKLISFFIFLNKLFFKQQLKSLKILFDIEIKTNITNVNLLKNKFYLNYYYYYYHIIKIIFMLKFISSLKFYK